MSLLDDAKRLAEESPTCHIESGYWRCAFCCVETPGSMSDLHAADCLWSMMPRIVAALEATQALAESLGSYVVERNTTCVAVSLVEAIVTAMQDEGR